MATNKKMREINKKIIVLFLVFTFVFSPVLAMPAQAQWVVWDPGNFVPNSITAVNTTISAGANVSQTVKDYGLDAVGWVIVNYIIERMAASTVKWINSGFKGSPAFVSNPEAFFGNMGDKIAGQFIFSSPNLNFLCGPLQAKIKLALSNNYTQRDRRNWQCSVTGIANNVDAFMNNFENGGWEGFFELSQGPNTPIGAYLQVEGEMMQQIANKQDLANKDLLQGKGFMSYKKCKSGTEVPPPDSNGLTSCDLSYNNCLKGGKALPGECSEALSNCNKNNPTAGIAVGDCADKNKETVTPGSVISDQLNKQLGLGQDKLAAADEINEIVSALLNKLVSSVVGGIGRGLRGLSRPDSTQTGSPTFTSQLAERKPGDQVVGYFCFDNETDPSSPQYDIDPNVCKYPDTPNTDILDVPPPNLDYDLNAGKPAYDPGYPTAP